MPLVQDEILPMNRMSKIVRHPTSTWIFLFIALVISVSAHADSQRSPLSEQASESSSLKLTTSTYQFSDAGHAEDVNLRHSSEYGNAWLGYFQSGSLVLRQWRMGWDRSFGESIRVSPSIQVALKPLKPPRKPDPGGSREFQPTESLREEIQIQ